MEFKGTKGKFKTKYINGFIRITDKHDNNVLDTPFKNINEANAQLIAHAPEMLEMLTKIIEKSAKEGVIDFSLLREANKLIQKATTI